MLLWCPYFGSNNVLDINMTMDNLMEKEKEMSLGISACEIFDLTVVTETRHQQATVWPEGDYIVELMWQGRGVPGCVTADIFT